MTSIRSICSGFDVAPAIAELEAHPEVWNRHRLRTESYATPHGQASDIWVRFNAWEHFDPKDPAAFIGPHESVWYPVADECPAVKALAEAVFRFVDGATLGGVLITWIPPNGRVEPHIDRGWHAAEYEKYAVQLKGNREQAFCFEGESLSPLPGELYWFRNDVLHWVENPSPEDRWTMIVCVKHA